MPVSIKEAQGVFRIVEMGGKLVKRSGKPVDGGGHKTRAAALAQMQAINISLKKRGKI